MSGPDLFVAGSGTVIGEYTTSGAIVNASLLSFPSPYVEPSIAALPTPEPSTLLLVPAGLLAAAVQIARRRRLSK